MNINDLYDLNYNVHFGKDENGLYPDPEDVFDRTMEDFERFLKEGLGEMQIMNVMTKSSNKS